MSKKDAAKEVQNIPTMKCPANNMPDEIKDEMWYFLEMGSHKSNIPALKEAVAELRHCMMQKTAGQKNRSGKKYGKESDIDIQANLDWIMWRIVMEATALVLSGDLDQIKDWED